MSSSGALLSALSTSGGGNGEEINAHVPDGTFVIVVGPKLP